MATINRARDVQTLDSYLDPPDIPDQPESERVIVGYLERGADSLFVALDEALPFALERTGIDPALVDMVLFCERWGEDGRGYCEWFYSGNWDVACEEGGA